MPRNFESKTGHWRGAANGFQDLASVVRSAAALRSCLRSFAGFCLILLGTLVFWGNLKLTAGCSAHVEILCRNSGFQTPFDTNASVSNGGFWNILGCRRQADFRSATLRSPGPSDAGRSEHLTGRQSVVIREVGSGATCAAFIQGMPHNVGHQTSCITSQRCRSKIQDTQVTPCRRQPA